MEPHNRGLDQAGRLIGEGGSPQVPRQPMNLSPLAGATACAAAVSARAVLAGVLPTDGAAQDHGADGGDHEQENRNAGANHAEDRKHQTDGTQRAGCAAGNHQSKCPLLALPTRHTAAWATLKLTHTDIFAEPLRCVGSSKGRVGESRGATELPQARHAEERWGTRRSPGRGLPCVKA